MTFKEVQELIKLLNKSDNLTEFKMQDGEFNLSIRTKDYYKFKKGSATPPPSILQMPAQPLPPAINSYQPASSPPPPSDSLPAAAPEPKKEEKKVKYIEVRSPIVGTFYRSASPEKPPYVKVGDRIEVGSVVCIVEAMKLFNEIESEVAGTIVKIVVDDASPVEYDQVLFLLEP